MKVIPIILCGGSGTRLWPLSRKSYPKQFIPLINGRSLLSHTIERLENFSDEMVLVTNEDYRFLAIEEIETRKVNAKVILEPSAKNTTAAIAIASLIAKEENALFLFCPADHYIPDIKKFKSTIELGYKEALQKKIVTFGIRPSYPATGYGYIEALNNTIVSPVKSFIEKPSLSRAQQFITSGNFFWNAGIFLCHSETILEAIELHAPDVLDVCKKASTNFTRDNRFIRVDSETFNLCRAESIDYAVLEKHDSLSVISFEGQWSDVGSWNAVSDLIPDDQFGNRIVGDSHLIKCSNTYINATNRKVVALGLNNISIIETPDAVLVSEVSCAEEVKSVVAYLETLRSREIEHHRKVARPWGWYDSIDFGENFQVKRIHVKPGASLSLQFHKHRSEHWIVVKGSAEVTIEDRIFLLEENQSTYIPKGCKHRLKNRTNDDLEIIEIQTGNYLGEDDITRLEDSYGRTSYGA